MEALRRDMKRQVEQTVEDQRRLSRGLKAQNEHLVAQNRSLERQVKEMSLQAEPYEGVYSLAQRRIVLPRKSTANSRLNDVEDGKQEKGRFSRNEWPMIVDLLSVCRVDTREVGCFR
ncbi:uncharacterized protein BDZ99DRAFT_466187 [Mytilinidion resinicola]|uniref:Uncharacterized protein n=1 Tax=Mytilinidion resinicola TaxID=574789 RepID=A0A6A6YAI8_9PEZI|nr:uncharacterized protein BDZ99DRAFT_466187 [Mytilinidion resinicola]KAF2805836.1 hypothetical protein BDZ99DRAFT_466187 [Mytilinidion resinicola]